jgi:uncharacterized DUF497 family protein
MEFIWEEIKREQVLAEHKVDFARIDDVFDDPFAVFIEDFKHSTDDELRLNVIGQSLNYGLIFLVFTYQGNDFIRFISARKAEKWMVKEYEENRKRL